MATGADSSPRLLEMVRNVLVTYKGTVGSPVSLADISKITRVEPITLISSSLASNKDLYNILHGVLNIYAAYYLQAVSILSAQLADVRILKILDKTNPDRDLKTLLTSGYIAYESLGNRASTPNKDTSSLTLENCKYKLQLANYSGVFARESILDEDQDNSLTTSIHKLETFERLGSAVGKVMEVKFKATQGDAPRGTPPTEITIPVAVKLDNMVIPNDVIGAILVSNKDEITLGPRFKDALNGRINFIKDFILCSDLIKTQKKTMIKDPTGAYAQLLKRINNSRIYSALSGNISLAGVSSIVVISDEDENLIQRHIGGKLTNENTRDMIFENTSAMMIVTVSEAWERVTIYVRDVSGYSQNSFDSFKGAADKGNNNIGDILKSFNLGSVPSF